MKVIVIVFTALVAIVLFSFPATSIATTWYILPDGTGDAPTIQAGVDLAAIGDTVLVACGTYYDCTHPGFCYENACVVLKSGVTIRSETGEPDCVTIDAEQNGRVFDCVNVDSTTVIEGFTITGGYIEADVMCIPNTGAGIMCIESGPRIKNCLFTENEGDLGDGVSAVLHSYPLLTDCDFIGNLGNLGAAVEVNDWSTATLNNCNFIGNSGGGLGCGPDSCIVNNCTFVDNTAQSGGGVSAGYSVLKMNNCEFTGNTATTRGGAISLGNADVWLTECTLEGNYSDGQGGGIWKGAVVGGSLWVGSSTILGNSSPVGADGWIAPQEEATIECCEVDTLEWIGDFHFIFEGCASDVLDLGENQLRITLEQPFPNPFNPQTTISFYNDQPQRVRIEVYDIRGHRITELTDQQYQVGEHSVEWQGHDSSGRAVPSGEYFFRVEIGDQVETRKAMLLR